MATTKKRKSDLMQWADEAIRNSQIYDGEKIKSESYNGQTAAFAVSVALSGLKPAMALYYNGSSSAGVDKKEIINLLAAMYSMDKKSQMNGKQLYEKVINAKGEEEKNLRRDITEYAIALKLTIRTFEFKKNG